MRNRRTYTSSCRISETVASTGAVTIVSLFLFLLTLILERPSWIGFSASLDGVNCVLSICGTPSLGTSMLPRWSLPNARVDIDTRAIFPSEGCGVRFVLSLFIDFADGVVIADNLLFVGECTSSIPVAALGTLFCALRVREGNREKKPNIPFERREGVGGAGDDCGPGAARRCHPWSLETIPLRVGCIEALILVVTSPAEEGVFRIGYPEESYRPRCADVAPPRNNVDISGVV